MFGQVWVLCAVSFVAGSGVTWLLFVRTPRRPPPVPPPPVTPMARWAPEPVAKHAAATPPAAPPSPVEPALANLDTHRDDVRRRHTGSAAAGALDRWGIGDAKRSAAEIPRQPGPADAPPPDNGR
ncbi:hypothetical protein CFP66_20015 [Pseudonocardia sp. MH-G8]|nr:hypothetical protein CFP66_20015 [Pseudonocardia sp. MH-G8]